MPAPRRAVGALLAVTLVAGCGSWVPPRPGSGAGGNVPGTTAGAAATAAPSAATLPPSPTPTASPSPRPTARPTSSPAPTPADTPWDPAKFGFWAKGMSGEVMAFMPVGQIRYAIDEMDWDVVSTVVFFSLEAGRNGRIVEDSGWRAWNSARMDELIAKAHATGTKVVMSLERFSWSPGQTRLTAALLGSAAARERLAREVAAEVVRRGVDGVNVDFEPVPAGRKAEFTAFVRSLRKELDSRRPDYQLTFAVVGHHGSYDIASLVGPDAADAVYLMGYQYSGTWSKVAGSTAPMGGGRYDVVDTVKGLLKSVEPHEIIVGAPFYGHAWPTATSALNARTIGGGFDVQYQYALATARAHGIRYDPVQQVAWTRYRARACATCPVHWYQLYFDDHRAIAYKWAWIKRQKLLGGGVWTIGFEGGPGALTAAGREAWLDPGPALVAPGGAAAIVRPVANRRSPVGSFGG
ncbi:MAG TPA: glycosyl hydrolase family 18 protein [Candidatus Limnocylindrales bacterium]|nr:glycosyl hydrolase family 18 protein [Candidatus Limnocylindrales bacterium]